MASIIVLISGKQCSGKSTLADNVSKVLRERNAGLQIIRLKFADPLYKMHDYCRGYLKQLGVKIPHPDTKDGDLLQLLGTEWGRKYVGENVWVDAAKGEVKEQSERLAGNGMTQIFIIDDCRFENEFNAFPEALRVRLNADPEIRKERSANTMWRDNQNHPSETSLDDYSILNKFDLTINTNVVDTLIATELVVSEIIKDNWLEKRKISN